MRGSVDARPIIPVPTREVTLPISVQDWTAVSFLHHAVDPSEVASRLPSGIDVDTFHGRAWVSLVLFRMLMRVGPLTVPGSLFPETNVRTYVIGPDGKRGLWFFSLDVANPIVAAAGAAIGLPYRWSKMSVEEPRSITRYTADRMFGGSAHSSIGVKRGRPTRSDDRDHFLTARFCLYAKTPVGLARVDVSHPRWSLREGSVETFDDQLAEAAGFSMDPRRLVVHTSAGVHVRVGGPRLLEAST